MAEFKLIEPEAEGRAGYTKSFVMALCPACVDQVKAAYLRVGKPRNVRTAGALFSGTLIDSLRKCGFRRRPVLTVKP